MVTSFERVPVALMYIVANLALGVHLYHGAWSLFQSLGWVLPWRRAVRDRRSRRSIVVGNISFPIAVVDGVIE